MTCEKKIITRETWAVNRLTTAQYRSSSSLQTETKLRNIPHNQPECAVYAVSGKTFSGARCIVPSTCRDLLLQPSAPNHHMHHHFGLIVFLSVCGGTTRCAGTVRAYSLFFLPHAWTVLQLCVGQTPRHGRPRCLAHGGVNNSGVASPYTDQVPPHYLGDWLTRIPRLWAVRNGCDFWPTVWCFCLLQFDRW